MTFSIISKNQGGIAKKTATEHPRHINHTGPTIPLLPRNGWLKRFPASVICWLMSARDIMPAYRMASAREMAH